MAEGGEVSYCNGPHKAECQYYAEGGEVTDYSQTPGFVPDEPQAEDHSRVPGFIPDEPTADYSQTLGFIPDDHAVERSSKYGSMGHQIAAGLEGAAQGFAGPVATLLETKVLGIPKEDIAGRQQEWPVTHGLAETAATIAGMVTGTGEAALAAKAAAKIAGGAKLGSMFLRGAINSGIIQAGDEVSKWMLGQGNPEEAVGAKLAHVAAAGLFGGLVGGAGGLQGRLAKRSIQELSERKIGTSAQSFLYGVASKASGEANDLGLLAQGSKKAFEAGQKYYDRLTSHMLLPGGSAALGAYTGFKENGLEGAAKGAAEGLLLGIQGELVKTGATMLGSKAAPWALKMLSSDRMSGWMQALDHAADVAKGSRAIDKGIENIFRGTGFAVQKAYDNKNRERLDKRIKDGAMNEEIQDQLFQPATTPGYAEGGEVIQSLQTLEHDDGIANHYPEQNLVLNIARGRVTNYLNSLRPLPPATKLAFDDPAENKESERTYNRALDIAVNPLSVLDEIGKGTIEPEHVQHLNALYPEVSGLLQRRLTDKITESQLNGEKPESRVRQGLSLFMGVPLSSEFQPMNIQAAQSVFASQQQAQQQAPAPKKSSGSKSSLTKSDQAYLTGGQALVKRQQRV